MRHFKKTAGIAAPLSLITASVVIAPAHASAQFIDETVQMFRDNEVYVYGSVGAAILMVAMLAVVFASSGRRRRRKTIAAYDNELTRYRQDLRRSYG